MTEDIGAILRSWRRATGRRQKELAHKLGVTQAAVSRWENGLDRPSPEQYAKLRMLMGKELRGQIDVERRILENQLGIRALVDVDGILLVATTAGLGALWPEMARYEGQQLADYLTGPSRDLYTDAEITGQIRRGEIAMIAGVSERHFESIGGASFRHNWSMAYRKIGTRHFAEFSFEPCDPRVGTGIHKILRVDEIA